MYYATKEECSKANPGSAVFKKKAAIDTEGNTIHIYYSKNTPKQDGLTIKDVTKQAIEIRNKEIYDRRNNIPRYATPTRREEPAPPPLPIQFKNEKRDPPKKIDDDNNESSENQAKTDDLSKYIADNLSKMNIEQKKVIITMLDYFVHEKKS
jgi:hypothetical protein